MHKFWKILSPDDQLLVVDKVTAFITLPYTKRFFRNMLVKNAESQFTVNQYWHRKIAVAASTLLNLTIWHLTMTIDNSDINALYVPTYICMTTCYCLPVISQTKHWAQTDGWMVPIIQHLTNTDISYIIPGIVQSWPVRPMVCMKEITQ